MNSLDVEIIYSKFSDINESLERLRSFRDVALDEFLSDSDKQDIASFRLIVATEAAIDICLHIAAKMLKRVPDEYAACFQLLGEHQLIDRDLSSRLAKMARFRNLLIHRYWQIDYTRLFEIITGPDIEDLSAFMSQVSRLTQEKGQ
jgi:uncharacterized protein YutE (UPF0331/DUF86 family)